MQLQVGLSRSLFKQFMANYGSRQLLERLKQTVDRNKDFPRWQNRSCWVNSVFFIATIDILPEILCRLFNASLSKELHLIWQIIEQCRSLLKEQRQIIFNALGGYAIIYICVDRAQAWVMIKMVMPVIEKQINGFGIQGKLPGRQQHELINGFFGALALRVKQAQGFNFIVEQIYAEWSLLTHGEDINNRAAKGEFAMFKNCIYPLVAGAAELVLKLGSV